MPALPYSLPYGYPVPQANFFFSPPLKNFCDLSDWFNQLILCGCGGVKDGQNWGFVINGFIYVAIWRDVAPRPPWTQAVWDVYVFSPPCGGCPSVSVGLGWFWCWDDVIKVVKSEAKIRWVPQWQGGGGQVVVIGTNISTPSTFEKEKGPILWLDDEYELDGNNVVGWLDKSGNSLKATQTNPINSPTLSGNFLQFDGSKWLDLRLYGMTEWHLFVVGKFNEDLANDFGTPFGAMGLVSPFSGIDALVSQNNNIVPKGTLSTFLPPNFVGGSLVSPENTVTLWEWKQDLSESFVGLNAVIQKLNPKVFNDSWDPMVLNGNTPLPVLASIGRSNRGLTLGQSFYSFQGEIGEILLYDFPLSSGKRTQVLNYFRKKYSLGAPISLPNPVKEH